MEAEEVENWLDANPSWMQDYIIRKADTLTINKWLTSRGLPTVQDSLQPGGYRRESSSQDSSAPSSPDPRFGDGHFFLDGRHQRSNSKKYLRHDFAKSKARSVFRTHESSFTQSREQSTLAERRSSLKGMRKFLSLPPTSGNILSMLIQSKVRLPRYHSKDEEHKRELHAANERDFFLEIVKDISHDLDLTSLTSRILVNISILVEAEWSSLFFVEGSKGKQSLVSKVFDLCTGTNCLPTLRGDNIVRIPWGQGIIGYVAETGKPVNIRDPTQVGVHHLIY
jgi:dual 3',5'-cyclic-AMP and -GMP phosphodiesterase 11